MTTVTEGQFNFKIFLPGHTSFTQIVPRRNNADHLHQESNLVLTNITNVCRRQCQSTKMEIS